MNTSERFSNGPPRDICKSVHVLRSRPWADGFHPEGREKNKRGKPAHVCTCIDPCAGPRSGAFGGVRVDRPFEAAAEKAERMQGAWNEARATNRQGE